MKNFSSQVVSVYLSGGELDALGIAQYTGGTQNAMLSSLLAFDFGPYLHTYIALQSLCLVFGFERYESVAFADARPIYDDFR